MTDPITASSVLRSDTGMVDPTGTYVSTAPDPKMSISSSNALRTSAGASCTAATISSPSSGVSVSSSMAWKISVACSLVTVCNTSGDVASFSASAVDKLAVGITGIGSVVVEVEVVDVVGTCVVVVGRVVVGSNSGVVVVVGG